MDELEFHNLASYDLPGFPEEKALYEDDSEVTEVIRSVRTTSSNPGVRMPPLLMLDVRRRLCMMPFTALTVHGDGRYYVCCMILSQKWFGNVMNESDVWNGIHFQQMGHTNTIEHNKN